MPFSTAALNARWNEENRAHETRHSILARSRYTDHQSFDQARLGGGEEVTEGVVIYYDESDKINFVKEK